MTATGPAGPFRLGGAARLISAPPTGGAGSAPDALRASTSATVATLVPTGTDPAITGEPPEEQAASHHRARPQ